MENYEIELVDLAPKAPSILKEVLVGLSRSQKTLPAKLLYDKRGAELFERICLLQEYYVTRAETEILKTYSCEIAGLIGRDAVIIEPGSGAGDKFRYLLPYLDRTTEYVPIEISKDILIRMTEELSQEYPDLMVFPICADFSQDFEISASHKKKSSKKVVFFPGSTIGNLHPEEAILFLKKFGKMIGQGGGIIIGVDLKKDAHIFKEAYDDPHGVTAEFNLNLLRRLNREIAAGFDLKNFMHEAFYNEEQGRVEMHLVSIQNHFVKVNETIFQFHEGESIHTENSYKYHIDEFCELAAKAKLVIKKYWKDHKGLFCVYYFEKV